MPRLLLYRRNEELLRVDITGDVLKVGRGPENDVVVPDPTVSRRQLTLERNGAGWRVKDQSGRGIEVNGKRVEQAKLANGTQVELAQWRAVFELSPGDVEA